MIEDGGAWYSLQEAARDTGYHAETIRTWTLGEDPIIDRRDEVVGKRTRVLVRRDQVRTQVARRVRVGSRGTAGGSSLEAGPLPFHDRDRMATLEQVALRRRMIDECRANISAMHEEIIGHQREIESLLLGPTGILND